MKRFKVLYFLLFLTFVFSCRNDPASEIGKNEVAMKKGTIQKEFFGSLNNGESVFVFKLKNKNGIELLLTNYGGIITQLKVPDRNGLLTDIVLGFDSLKQYLEIHPYFGAIIGRYGNRIAKGKFSLDGKAYKLATNNNGNHLHGGLKGFDKVLWDFEEIHEKDYVGLRLKYLSPDGEEGYPGNLSVEVLYTLNNENEWGIEYKAEADQATVVNLTNHTYFNFNGCREDVLRHRLFINSKKYLPVNELLIPLGKIVPVDGTPLDFSEFKAMGTQIEDGHEQLIIGNGYDHCYVIEKEEGAFDFVGAVIEPGSGIMMEVFSSEPALQLYTANYLDGTLIGKKGVVYKKRYGFCLETQHYPDSPNQADFPSTRLDPGQVYTSKTVYKFSNVE